MSAWLMAATLVLLQVPDVLTTNAILEAGGRELNPLMRLFQRLGRAWWVPKLGMALVGAAYLGWHGGNGAVLVLALLNVLYLLVVWSNLRQMERIRRQWRRLQAMRASGWDAAARSESTEHP